MIFDRIENAKNYDCLGAAFQKAFRRMEAYDAAAFVKGKTDVGDGLSLVQIETETRDHAQVSLEAHRKYADVMFLVQGEEVLFYKPTAQLTREKKPYTEEIDALLTEMNDDAQKLRFTPGSFVIFFPQDGHGADGMIDAPKAVRRCVIKVPLN